MLENLPNVYIKEVVIDSYGKTKLSANCTVYVKDLKDGQARFQWYDNHDLRKTMKIMIVASTNRKFNENIKKANRIMFQDTSGKCAQRDGQLEQVNKIPC